MEYPELIAKRILQLCKERNITIHRLATLSEISDNSLEKIVQGKTKRPALHTIHSISLALDMKITEFLDFDEMNEVTFSDLRKVKR